MTTDVCAGTPVEPFNRFNGAGRGGAGKSQMRPLAGKQPVGHIGKPEPPAQLSDHQVIRFGPANDDGRAALKLTT